MTTLSLLKHCESCEDGCCGNLEDKRCGSPILDKGEVAKIISKKGSLNGGILKRIKLGNKQGYYILLANKDTGNCPFLTGDYECEIQDIKPLDCQIYPIKAIYSGKGTEFIVDEECPANDKLSNYFKKCKKTCLEINEKIY